MDIFHIDKGLLKGVDVEIWDAAKLGDFARSEGAGELTQASLYSGELRRLVFRGITFTECSFARTRFVEVTFRRCKFKKVDLTRALFRDCHFSDCIFENCDPYNCSFLRTVVDPATFKPCYGEKDWNRALILFANLKLGFEKAGNGRLARATEYRYRIWERRRLYHLWRDRETSGPFPWVGSLLVGSLTGYGERPAYVAGWMIALITAMSFVYRHWFPFVATPADNSFARYWYFSFKVFCARGFAPEYATAGLLACQVVEFALGLVLIALLVGSITRKLS
jgi:Pentapeptide repeats (9 copies)